MLRTVLAGMLVAALPALAMAQEKQIVLKPAPMTNASDGAAMYKA
jgi:hypothetical protein